VLVSLSSPRDDPSAAAQFHDQVEHLCTGLTDLERRLLELRLEGYRSAEIARELKLSDVALRVRLTRMRQRLRACGVLDDCLSVRVATLCTARSENSP
jgi:DNA-directed RNA polymerase specialized sigma24 family protein